MGERTKYPTILVVVAIFLLIGACASGYIIGHLTANGGMDSASNSSGSSTTDELFDPFWEAWELVHSYYLEQPVDEQLMMQGAIRGMLESLGDQHTSYMAPSEFETLNSQMQGYDGIGAYVSTDGDFLTIIEPIKGSPAEAVGLRSGDEIIAIDGEDMTGVLPEIARTKVLGPAGSSVILTIRREGVDELFDVEITRAHVVIPSVESEMLEGQIAYVSLSTFGETSADELKNAILNLLADKPNGLILDLRNNSGGYLDSAIDVGSLFLPGGVVAFEEYGDGTRVSFETTIDEIATDIPMIVLVNEWSASASELVAGALQDRGRAQLVGAITFGKGTVQSMIPISDDQGAVRITIARWLTPNGTSVHETGLIPDYEVEFTEEDMLAGIDTQLDRAVELLSQP